MRFQGNPVNLHVISERERELGLEQVQEIWNKSRNILDQV